MADSLPLQTSADSHSSPDLGAIIGVLRPLLAAAARLANGARIPDYIHLTDSVVQLCLNTPVIRALPSEKQREVVNFITSYISLLTLRPLPSSSPVECVFSTGAAHVRVHAQQDSRPEATDAWVSRHGVYIPHRPASLVYPLGVMLYPITHDLADDTSDSDMPDLVDID
ncbi:hypothetical protein K466DRAFT_569465 [Polyporus arcularius HHB13444]|uniref:Uncharacterized protein n=1 Tax=Polyporus arcularius HHB13444 TaxID=1314778 RepID=A0A5C3NW32_9APHY|nr:hypothetical protein K466DRAFT_569465 [Polyporus arcularius HHB13444]